MRYKSRCNCSKCPAHSKKWSYGKLLSYTRHQFQFLDSAGNLHVSERKNYWIDVESIGPRGGKKWVSIFHHEIVQRQQEQENARKEQALKRS